MRIWVDADACPKPVKEILFRVSQRRDLEVILVANQFLPTPSFHLIRSVQVAGGFDVADNYICQHAEAGDVAITADIPLAAELVSERVHVLGPRGQKYTRDNIQQRLTMRNFMEEMRNSGEVTGGPSAFSSADKQAFANALDRLLATCLS